MKKKAIFFERIKGKDEIEAVFKKGKTIISTDKKIKANILSSKRLTNKVKVGVAVSSKAGNSVWRNRLKRIIRESIRQEMMFLKEQLKKDKQGFSIIFSSYRLNQENSNKLFLKNIKPAVIDIFNKVAKRLAENN